MNVDFAFMATPAKCRLLLSLQQYSECTMDLPKEIHDIAQQDLLQFEVEEPNEFEIEEQQVCQFLADMGNRAAIIDLDIPRLKNVSFLTMIKAAKMAGHEKIMVFSMRPYLVSALFRENNIKIEVLSQNFFLDTKEDFTEKMQSCEDYLVLYYMNDVSQEPDSLLRAISHHFKKIWVYINETETRATMKGEVISPHHQNEITYFGDLKQILVNVQKDNDYEINPAIYMGILDIPGKICYYPKLKF